MKGSSEFWAAAGSKGKCLDQIVFAHGCLEVGKPKRSRVGSLLPPMRVQADSHESHKRVSHKCIFCELSVGGYLAPRCRTGAIKWPVRRQEVAASAAHLGAGGCQMITCGSCQVWPSWARQRQPGAQLVAPLVALACGVQCCDGRSQRVTFVELVPARSRARAGEHLMPVRPLPVSCPRGRKHVPPVLPACSRCPHEMSAGEKVVNYEYSYN